MDHDTQILSEADWLVEMGPKAGADGGRIIAQGTIPEIAANPDSRIGTFLKETHHIYRKKADELEMFSLGTIHLSTDAIHTVKSLEADIPKGRLTVVTGVSGSGKTRLILESLIPALKSMINGTKLPSHIFYTGQPVGCRYSDIFQTWNLQEPSSKFRDFGSTEWQGNGDGNSRPPCLPSVSGNIFCTFIIRRKWEKAMTYF